VQAVELRDVVEALTSEAVQTEAIYLTELVGILPIILNHVYIIGRS
jgi:hypothetical protein